MLAYKMPANTSVHCCRLTTDAYSVALVSNGSASKDRLTKNHSFHCEQTEKMYCSNKGYENPINRVGTLIGWICKNQKLNAW